MQFSELKEFVREAKDNKEFYNWLYTEYQNVDFDNIDTQADFREQVPVTSKDVLLKHFSDGNFDLGIDEMEQPIFARPTSGTTSEMACYYRTEEEIEAHCERVKEATGHYFEGGKGRDKVLVATTFSLAPVLTRQFMEMDCMVTSASPFDLDRTAEVFRTMKCNTLVCSPPVALKLSEKLDEMGYEGLEKYYFVSSGLSSMTESRLNELYPDAEIMLQYGLAETGILMQQCEHLKHTNQYHLFDDDAFFYEFVTEDGEEADPGEIGEIVVTKLNSDTPLIRYGVGDLFEVRGECSCGKRTYKFIGRKEDKFKIQGVTVFADRIENALEPVKDSLKHYQIIIEEEGGGELPKPKMVLRLEFADDTSKEGDEIVETFSENFQVANDYNWKKGVEMGLFAPVEFEETVFEKRKFRKVKDLRYE